MKITCFTLLTLLLLFLSSILNSQTIYGVSGLIKTPDAYIVENGQCAFGGAFLQDNYDKKNLLYRQRSIYANIGFHSRFELGVRIAIFPDLPGDSEIFNVGFDKLLSAKVVILEEDNDLPQLAVGMQDIVGPRYHNSTYLVVSKQFPVLASLNLLLNLGYGTKLNELIFDEAENYDFQGVYGGVQISLFEMVGLLAEYDGKNFNSGLRFKPVDWVTLHFSFTDMEYPVFGANLISTI